MRSRFCLFAFVAFALACGFTQTQAGNDQNHSAARFLLSFEGPALDPIPEQFVATVDTRPVRVSDISRASRPLKFAVLLDVSGSNRDKAEFLRKYSFEVFNSLLQKGYTGWFGDFNDELYLSRKTASVEEAMKELKLCTFRGGSAIYDSISTTGEMLAKDADSPAERLAVFVLTDGEDKSSRYSATDVTERLQRKGVAVFGVITVGNNPQRKSIDEFSHLTLATGGTSIILNGGKNFIPELLRLLENQYWVTLEVPAAKDKKIHRLEIKSTDGKVQFNSPTAITLQ